MHDVERVLGALEEFKEWAKDEFKLLRSHVDDLRGFKWKIYGGVAVIVTVMEIAREIIMAGGVNK